LTIEEYEILGKAFQWKRLDQERDYHKVAWLDRMAKATDDKGKYLYDTFKKFFKEDEYKEDLGIKVEKKKNKEYKRLADIAMQVNSGKEWNK